VLQRVFAVDSGPGEIAHRCHARMRSIEDAFAGLAAAPPRQLRMPPREIQTRKMRRNTLCVLGSIDIAQQRRELHAQPRVESRASWAEPVWLLDIGIPPKSPGGCP